jgi:serine/threonine protein kinase
VASRMEDRGSVKAGRPEPEAELAPATTGDPMASIRPPLPSAPPLRAPTVELAALDDDDSHPGRDTGDGSPTLLPEIATHESGPFVIPVRETDGGTDDPSDDSAYVLLDMIGEGGMGEVWQSRQRSLGRLVALKRLRRGADAPQAIVRQFESEARLTGVLDHPNIVTVHELGRDQHGRVFYTMKRIVGTPWSQLIGEGVRIDRDGTRVPLELRDHLEILLEVANAIAFAHSRGVIHRDIKPGNVMVGDYGEVQVVDWGLAVAVRPLALLGGAETWTIANLPRNALTCGTPAYMSPETATAEREQICPATDVYLLGAVLYHVLYGRPPHRGRTVAEVIEAAKRNAWTLPERVPSKLRPWNSLLRPILVRALASDPTTRHPDAAGFAEALRVALRNFDSAKQASGAAEQLAALDLASCTAFVGYQELAKIVARFEQALQDWPGNIVARRGLTQARLTLAEFALGHRDIGFAEAQLDAFESMPAPPESAIESLAVREDSRAIPMPDHTLVGAPQPADTMVASAGAGADSLEATAIRVWDPKIVGAMNAKPAELLERLGSTEPHGTRVRSSSALRRLIGPSATLSAPHSGLSASIEQHGQDPLEVEREQWTWAITLRTELRARALDAERRRVNIRLITMAAIVFGAGLITVLVLAGLFVVRERDRATAERNRLSEVLLDEAAETTEAQLAGLFRPVHGALMTAVRWARLGLLDGDEPEQLNRLFIPLLDGVPMSASMVRADASGREYLLLRADEGWRTRTTEPGKVPKFRDWTTDLRPIGSSNGNAGYDPLVRPWYVGGASLRTRAEQAHRAGRLPPVHWTPPYTFISSNEPGISVSTPVTSPGGRAFVIGFDLKLNYISNFTESLPKEIEQGQVFVLDDDDRLLGLPRETSSLPERRTALILRSMADLAGSAPLSHQAWAEWVARDRPTEPFRLAVGEDEFYWVEFRRIAEPDLPRLWIGVILPESHFVN